VGWRLALKLVKNPYRDFRASLDTIQLGMPDSVRFSLSRLNVEAILGGQACDNCHEPIHI
tara:strand:- start:175 stop:354 length:180 start_codon:yes stop_codon:yes gene_type:complete